MFNQVDPKGIAQRLEAAINADTPPQRLFYEFINSQSMEANFLYNLMLNNKQILRLITSPRGRRWIKKHIDGFLNYLETLEKI